MGSERDDAHLPPDRHPRRRKQIALTEEDRDRIERHLERMPLERDALLLAMRQFGEDFDRDAWQQAYEAFTAKEHNRVVQVKELCDRLRHEYAYVDADDMHAAAHTLLKLIPGFTASYVQWLAEYGIDLS